MLVANNAFELEIALRNTDISVPRRSEGRTKEHTERYAVAHILSALLVKGYLSYPVKLDQRERPDFHLKAGGVDIGIEHTEAVPQNEAHKTVLMDHNNGTDVYFIPHHKPNEPIKTRGELMEEINANISGTFWAGDSVEWEWCEAMLHFVRNKIVTASKEGFEKFKKNWLLIYDNWTLPVPNRKKAAQFLFPEIIKTDCFDTFSTVYIITGSVVLEFCNTGFVSLNINNLWE